MKYSILFILFISSLGFSQHEDLLNIIDENTSLEIRQQKIDSFLNKNKSLLSSKILADCYHDLGSKWFFKNWRTTGNEKWLHDGIKSTQKAVVLKKKLDSLDKTSLKKSLYNLGVFHANNEDVYSSINSYNSLIELGEADTKTQFANLELGRTYAQIGDFHKAINSFERIITYYKHASPDYRRLMMAHINLADTYYMMGSIEKSAEIKFHLDKADSIYNITGEDNIDLKTDLNQIQGNRLLETNHYREAIGYHKEVLTDSLYMNDNSLARVYNSIAYSQLQLEEYESALSNLNKAISFDVNYTDPYNNQGDLYLAQNEFEHGLYFYQKALVYSIDKSREIRPEELLSIEDLELATEKIFLLNHITTKANGWLKYYEYDNNKDHLTHALNTFALADQLVDIIRSESTEYQSKLFWREKGATLYAKAVEVCYLLDKPQEAYYFMERNKALLLLEDISTEQAKEIAMLPDAMAEREFQLKQAIFLSENEFKNFESTSPDSLEMVKQEVFKNKRMYNTFVDSLAMAFPEYANIKKKVDVLPYPDFKSSYTSGDEIILQYILNEEQGYGLLTTADQTQFFKLEDVATLNEQIISLYGQLTDLATDRNKMKAFNALSHQVFRALVPETVYDAIKGKKLTLITDYSLQQIPFEAFVVNGDSITYLIEDTEIRYAYSMSYLDAKKQVTNHPKKELFGMAPVQFASLGLPELLFSGAEIGEAEKIFAGKVALNGEATKVRFLENVEDSRIVHLSTHADIGEGIDPWIAFSDKKMFLNEIYATKNEAEMVVLSACNTSVGELKKGEGAMSLARGFFHSGAKSVVSSLWSTNDKSSKELMVAFYRGLDKGLTKSAAMRKAKIDYIDQYRGTTISPAYWSALIVIGDNSPISSAGNTWSLWVWAILGVLVLSALYFIFNKKKAHCKKSF